MLNQLLEFDYVFFLTLVLVCDKLQNTKQKTDDKNNITKPQNHRFN